MIIKLTSLLLLITVLLLQSVQAQDTLAQHYKIYSVAEHKIIAIGDVVSRMAAADVLFFGEEHNDATGHQLELMLLEKLYAKYGSKTALSMEMFETDCQTVLDEYLKGYIRESDFMAASRPWGNYQDYRPLVEFAKTNGLPVIAANAPGRYTSMVNRMGLGSLQTLSATGKSYLPPLPIDTATGAYYEKFAQIMGGHGAMGGMQIYQAQNLWDATMGYSIASFLKKNAGCKVLQINGGFHSEEKLGAAAQLKHYYPQVKIINIAAYADDNFETPDWGKFSKNGDYIILTDPKLPRSY